ncbi:hypothetical protein ERJ75_001786400 [Trypanosoma vivax]|nr:hypothetical protein ERJ75_001786400 [Trypanosoma vivax]
MAQDHGRSCAVRWRFGEGRRWAHLGCERLARDMARCAAAPEAVVLGGALHWCFGVGRLQTRPANGGGIRPGRQTTRNGQPQRACGDGSASQAMRDGTSPEQTRRTQRKIRAAPALDVKKTGARSKSAASFCSPASKSRETDETETDGGKMCVRDGSCFVAGELAEPRVVRCRSRRESRLPNAVEGKKRRTRGGV